MTVKKQDEDAPLNFFNQVELSYYNTSIDSFGACFGCITIQYNIVPLTCAVITKM